MTADIREKIKIRTSAQATWCPGCSNFLILAAVQKIIEKYIEKGKKKDDFAIVAGIGCHAKIFDYLDIGGINTLHGRVAPTCLGIKLAKPNVSVLGFSGDGDAYAEGIEHLIHSARYNSDFKYLVHNNQVFALTMGQPTPTTKRGYVNKTNPRGVVTYPFNPIRLMLVAGASFVARVYADLLQIQDVLEEALKHKGFAFIEVLQPCLIFQKNEGYKIRTYSLQKEGHNKSDFNAAMLKAEEFDYNSDIAKIPLGIFYQKERETFEELKLKK